MAGLAIAGAIVIAISLWFILKMARKRAAKKREENMGTAFLSVRGVVRDDNLTEKGPGSVTTSPVPVVH
jgi:hypothetical protein